MVKRTEDGDNRIDCNKILLCRKEKGERKIKLHRKGRSTNIIPREVQEKEGIKFLFFFVGFFDYSFLLFSKKEKARGFLLSFKEEKRQCNVSACLRSTMTPANMTSSGDIYLDL